MKTHWLFFALPALLLSSPEQASGQLFGKNRVQYTPFKWRYIQSAHFDVYHYEGAEEIAEFVAETAESSYVRVSRSWGYHAKDRIVLIVYRSHNDFEQSNLSYGPPQESVGGFTEFFRNRIVIPYEGSSEQLRHVTHHELTHALMLQMLYGESILAGFAKAPVPLWFIEGLAEYEARGWDTESDMFLRDAVVNGYLQPVHRLGGFLNYKGGQSFFHFIAQVYGAEKVGEILIQTKYLRGVHRAVQQSLGMGLEELSRQWHKHLRKVYWSDFAERQEPEAFATRLTDHRRDQNYVNTSGELSPAGNRLVYLSDRTGFFDIYLISALDGAPLARVVSGQKSGRLEELHWLRPGTTWHPDGTRIAFAAKSGDQDAIHVVDVARRKIVQSFKFGLDAVYAPDWSPDGTRLVFVGTRNGASDLYVYELATQHLSQLTDDLFSDLEPQWSPDGSHVLFVSDRRGFTDPGAYPRPLKIHDLYSRQFDIYTVNVATRQIERVTDTEANEKSPVWSPDGTKIAFVSDRNGIYNIFIKEWNAEENVVLAAVGRPGRGGASSEEVVAHDGAYPITNVLTGIDHLSWEGERLAFTAFFQGGYDVYVMNVPLRIKPGDVRLSLTPFQRQRRAEPEKIARPAPSAPDSSYRQFVFGEAFKRGKPLTPRFLSETDYKEDTGGYKTKPYRTRFSPDMVLGAAGYNPYFGLQGAAAVSFSDMMGNHRLNLATDFFVNFTNSNFYVSYQHLPRRIDYTITLFSTHYAFFSGGRFPIRDRNLGLDLALSRPFDRFHRIELSLNLRDISRRIYRQVDTEELALRRNAARVAVFRLAYVKDNVLWGFTGPRAGTRYRLSVWASPDLGRNGLDFRTYQFDFRTYHRFARRYTFAFRLTAGLSEGRHRQSFFLGGLDNWFNLAFNAGTVYSLETQFFSNLVTPLRGYDFYEQVGSKFFLSNLELRIPLVNYLDMTWPLPVRLSHVRGVLFVDVGSAWDSGFTFFSNRSGKRRLEDVLMSFGWGVRVNLGFLLFKYDLAWRTDVAGISRARGLFSIGTDF